MFRKPAQPQKIRKPVPYVPPHRKNIEGANTILRPFNYASQSVNLNSIQWENIEAIELSDSGSTKVVLVETKEGSLVLRTSGEVGKDYFLYQLAHCLNIPCPKMRLMSYEDEEFSIMNKAIERAAFHDEVLHYRLLHRFDVAFVELIEYIPGQSLSSLGQLKAQMAFQVDDDSGKERMIKLGMQYAFDIFLINGDRYPLDIWRTDGNVENFILKYNVQSDITSKILKDPTFTQISIDNFYGIDHMAIVKASGNGALGQDKVLQKYYDEVNTLLTQIFCIFSSYNQGQNIKDMSFNCLSKFQELIHTYSLHKLCQDTLFHVLIGIVNGIVNITRLGIGKFELLRKSLLIGYDKDWCGNYNKNLELIHSEFYGRVIDLFSKFIDQNPETVSLCNRYKLNEQYFTEITKQKEVQTI